MGTAQLASILSWLLAVWLGGLALVLIVKGLAFLNMLRHLVASDLGAVVAGRFDPARVQMAAVSAFAAAVFIYRSWHAITGPVHAMPEIPDGLLTLVAGSHAIYLSGQVSRSHNTVKGGE